jgi:hypothetical protein
MGKAVIYSLSVYHPTLYITMVLESESDSDFILWRKKWDPLLPFSPARKWAGWTTQLYPLSWLAFLQMYLGGMTAGMTAGAGNAPAFPQHTQSEGSEMKLLSEEALVKAAKMHARVGGHYPLPPSPGVLPSAEVTLACPDRHSLWKHV